MKFKKLINKLTCSLLITSMLTSMTGCGAVQNDSLNTRHQDDADIIEETESKEPVTIDSALLEKITQSSADFSIDLFKECFKNRTNDNNILISPLSIQLALGMTANGADNKTLAEIENVLCNGSDINDFNTYAESLNYNGKQLKLANSVWIKTSDEAPSIARDFIDLNKKTYNAEIYNETFDNSTVDKINNWVSNKTDNMIPSLINTIPYDTVMYLVNAAAFQAEWAKAYSDDDVNDDCIFTNIDGNEEQITMIRSTENFYLESDDAVGFIKPYKKNDYSFMAILPNEDISLADYLQDFDGSKYMDLYNSRNTTVVLTYIPEFSYSYDTNLISPLNNLGINEAFDMNADFSKMTENGSKDLYISDAIHKTYISVDRAGTKASASTGMQVSVKSAEAAPSDMKHVELTRPFVYAIIDNNTGLPVFLGTVHSCENK